MRPLAGGRRQVVALWLGLSACLPTINAAAETVGTSDALATIPAIDLPRYMGTWYEIARYPNSFQKKCVGFTRADYRIQPDATVQVINQCRLADGTTDTAVGSARQIGAATSPKLKVRFAPAWLSWLPMVWGDYWVIDLDQRYQMVAVSEPKRQYLWILSRTPTVEPSHYQALLGRLQKKGFSLQNLLLTPQK